MTVEELLKQKDIFYTSKGGDFIIHCLNPEHDDKSPSCRIDKITGVLHCFSCGFKGNIFNIFNIQRDRLSEKVYQLLTKIQDIKIATRGLEIPPGSVPFSRNFRNISSDTFSKFEAFTNDKEFPDRVVFPLRDITGRIVLFQGRHLFLNGKDKYYNFPAKTPLFPYPQKVSPLQGSIILVEGIFDMLNLHDKGLTNAVAVFGVSTMKGNVSEKLKNFKLQGVKTVYIMFDGDKAGREFSAGLFKDIKSYSMFECEEITLDDGVDPGELSLQDVENLRRNIYE